LVKHVRMLKKNQDEDEGTANRQTSVMKFSKSLKQKSFRKSTLINHRVEKGAACSRMKERENNTTRRKGEEEGG